jgi:hypothetical protein
MIDMNQFGKKARLKAVKMTDKEAESLYNRAVQAGVMAVEAAMKANTIRGMIVGTPTTLFGDDIDYSKPVDYVADGPCGFAKIEIRPSVGGFAAWARKNGKARYSDYHKCAYIGVSAYNQSFQKKEIYGNAFAAVLREAGIDAYCSSTMD